MDAYAFCTSRSIRAGPEIKHSQIVWARALTTSILFYSRDYSIANLT